MIWEVVTIRSALLIAPELPIIISFHSYNFTLLPKYPHLRESRKKWCSPLINLLINFYVGAAYPMRCMVQRGADDASGWSNRR